jgi:DNA-binding IclR family transcriptional regulator
MIRSLQRGLTLLEIVGKREQATGLADLSRELALHPSTVFHLLKTLLALGYVAQPPGHKTYRLGPKIFSLASAATHEQALVDLAMPHLVELVRVTGETSHLAIYDRGEVVVIAKLDGSGPIRLTERIGTPRPAHATAIGKVLLAGLTHGELKAHLSRGRLERFTPRTITRPPRLRAELLRVRDQGYALDDEEYSPGLRCVAAPVRDFAGRVVGALGLSGPVWRTGNGRLADLAEIVCRQAQQVSAALGHAKSPSPLPSPPALRSPSPPQRQMLSLPRGRGRKEKAGESANGGRPRRRR